MASRADSKSNKSSNLDRTLQDLESAFADWESLSASKPRAATDSIPLKKSTKAGASQESAQDVELRKKTKKLLRELRRQLSDLT